MEIFIIWLHMLQSSLMFKDICTRTVVTLICENINQSEPRIETEQGSGSCGQFYRNTKIRSEYNKNTAREIDSERHGRREGAPGLGSPRAGSRHTSHSRVTCHARPLIVCDVTLIPHSLPTLQTHNNHES